MIGVVPICSTPIAGEGAAFGLIPGCMNETLRAYINGQLGFSNTDLEPLLDYWLDVDANPDKTVAFRELILDTGIEN